MIRFINISDDSLGVNDCILGPIEKYENHAGVKMYNPTAVNAAPYEPSINLTNKNIIVDNTASSPLFINLW